ncbi:FtsX-like permease family protein [Parabacteroides sp. PF5-9]|uniref:ABC transporter permease n=1 Tax=Parabacteroides sp. PF5-9 TaxID=1742404 RepID=UPI0024750EBB|nr:FtsX-like permease family protein [Parabacteroides sp. PF5-9]MDH6357817.1 putative ABC transport system permease protein [Parabacteroides sp. PF5-9]
MIKKTIKQLWNERRSNLLIGLELLVVSVFLWYTVDELLRDYKRFSMPLGFDISHVYYVELSSIPSESPDYVEATDEIATVGADFLTIIDRLRLNPDIEYVGYTSGIHFHYRWSNRYTSFQVDTAIVPQGFVRPVGSSYFDLFQVKTADGGSPQLLIEALERGEIVVTKRVAEKFFGNAANAIGKDISCIDQGDTESRVYRIGGVCEDQRYNEFSSYDYAYYQLISASEVRNTNSLGYPLFIRTKPVADKKDFPEKFRKEMESQLKIGNIYLKNIQPMSERRSEHIRSWIDGMRMNIAVVVFFLLNVFLGVIGTFWLRTQQKRGEIGLRIALGSTRKSIFGMLLSQGVIILVIAFLIGAVIFCNFWFTGVLNAVTWVDTTYRLVIGMGMTFALLLVMICIGISFPAYRAMKEKPAEALHYE